MFEPWDNMMWRGLRRHIAFGLHFERKITSFLSISFLIFSKIRPINT